jgi:alpha/beta hydrolase fold
VVGHGFPGSRRQRYDRLRHVPERLIVLGDALCSFNPVYGQGITVSALEAEQLGAALAASKAGGDLGPDFSARWFARLKPIVDAAWDGVWIEDSRFPELSSGRSLRLKASQWYVGRLHRATYRDARVTDQFYRVLGFIDPPSSLFYPRVAFSALFAQPGRGRFQPRVLRAPRSLMSGAPEVPGVVHDRITTNGITLHVAQAGPVDGDLVILLHGFPEPWWGWRHQIPALAQSGFRVLAPDQRGYNFSDKPLGRNSYRITTLAQDVLGLIDAMGRQRAAVVGHDWGGAVAWWLATYNPDRVERVAVLNCPHPVVFPRVLKRTPAQLLRSWYMFFVPAAGVA